MNQTSPPKAMRWTVLVSLILVGAIAIGLGVQFAGPIRATGAKISRWVGIGHDRTDQDVAKTSQTDRIQYYTCGMHPWVILPRPGDCPICHMTLTPVDPKKFTGEIAIDPVIVQDIGVRVAPVVTGPLTRTIRTVGVIDYNERTVRDINIKIDGWIEKLYVDFVGDKVKAGQPLFDLYSPQLYAAQEEYLLALKNRDRIGSDISPDAAQGAMDLLAAARTRLEYFDITDTQIAELEKRGKPSKTMTLRSPYTGVVIAKHANEGMKVDPGMQAFRLADLSTVWVLVTLYEYQLPYVEQGMKATMTLPYLPGLSFEGKVIYIYPYLNTKTREVQVRLEFKNLDYQLKPGMFARVQLENTLAAKKTLAPREAIIDTGERKVAFVSQGRGKFEPRNVRTGVETGDGMVAIISGLKPGEKVVTSGQFLIDSEAKFREALIKMIKGDLASDQQTTAVLAGTSVLKKLPDPLAAKLQAVLNHYLAIGETLANDKTTGLADHARQLASAINEAVALDIPADPQFWHEHQDAVATARASALKLADAANLETARLQFADLSTTLESVLLATGVPPSFGREVQVLHCPMYRPGQGGTIWLQTAGDVHNPYLGSKMIGCFDQRKGLPVTGQSPASPSTDQNRPGRTGAGKTIPDKPRADTNPPAQTASSSVSPASGPKADNYPIDFCLVSGEKLDAMGDPVTITYQGRTLKFCCQDCISKFQQDPQAYLKKLDAAAATLGHTQGKP